MAAVVEDLSSCWTPRTPEAILAPSPPPPAVVTPPPAGPRTALFTKMSAVAVTNSRNPFLSTRIAHVGSSDGGTRILSQREGSACSRNPNYPPCAGLNLPKPMSGVTKKRHKFPVQRKITAPPPTYYHTPQQQPPLQLQESSSSSSLYIVVTLERQSNTAPWGLSLRYHNGLFQLGNEIRPCSVVRGFWMVPQNSLLSSMPPQPVHSSPAICSNPYSVLHPYRRP
jgi:hypothetical protein